MPSKLIPWLLVLILILALVLPVFADRRAVGDPQPKPWQWGDPDWPALSKRDVDSCQGAKPGLVSIGDSEITETMNSLSRSDCSQAEKRVLIVFGRLGIAISIRR